MWGIGKKQSALGKWLDKIGYSQEDLMSASGVGKNTISKACSDPDYIPSTKVMKKLLKAVRVVDPNLKMDDFWDL